MSGRVREHLAELHEGGPKVLADQPQPAGPVVQRRLDTRRHSFDGTNDPFQVQGGDDVVVAVADERRQDLPVAGKIAEMADGFTQQGITAFTSKRSLPACRSVSRDPQPASLDRSVCAT